MYDEAEEHMTRQLRAERFHFQKTAGKRVRGGRLEWEQEVDRMLSETAPFVVAGGMETRIEWDENDPEQGFALGKVAVMNRPPQPAVLPRQDQQLQRLGIGDTGKTAMIPIHVENSEIGSLSLFLDDKGMAHPLTEKRWSEVMGAHGMMGEVDPNMPDPQAVGTLDAPRGAAGFDRLSNVKVAEQIAEEQGDFVILEGALKSLHPIDHARIVKLASDPAVLAGLSASRLFPVMRMMIETQAVATRDYNEALVGSLPVNLALIEEMQPTPTSTLPKKWRATLVSDRYFAPKYIEGSYSQLVDQLRSLIPNIGDLIEQGGTHLVELDRKKSVVPVVLESVTTEPPQKVVEGGNWMVMNKKGDVLRMDVMPNYYGFDGKPVGGMLFIGDGYFGMTTDAFGKLIAAGQHLMPTTRSPMLPGAPVPRGTWISIVLPGSKYTEPVSVRSAAIVAGSPVILGETYTGKIVALRFVEGLQAMIKGVGATPVEFSAAAGYTHLYLPMESRIVALGEFTTIEDSSIAVKERMASYVRTGASVSGRNVMRFTRGDEAEAARVTVRYLDKDQWAIAGLPVGSVIAQNAADDVSTPHMLFILTVLGCSKAQAQSILSVAQSKGRATIVGLRGVKRVVEESGKVGMPFLQKMAGMAVRLRQDVSDKDRETMFKAASTMDVVAIGQSVRQFLSDEKNCQKLAFLGSILPRFAEKGDVGLMKVAEIFSHPESIDSMLGLNVLNERTVTHFLRNLPRLKRAEDHMAELLMLSRQGLAGVKSDDVEEGMKSLNRVVEKLEYLDSQVSEYRSKEQFA